MRATAIIMITLACIVVLSGSACGGDGALAASRIAFVSDSEVYVMDADGSNQTRLTSLSAQLWSPSWQP